MQLGESNGKSRNIACPVLSNLKYIRTEFCVYYYCVRYLLRYIFRSDNIACGNARRPFERGTPHAIVFTQGHRVIIHMTTLELAGSSANRSVYDRITSRNAIVTSRISNAICPYN